jgi:hypothetical protein
MNLLKEIIKEAERKKRTVMFDTVRKGYKINPKTPQQKHHNNVHVLVTKALLIDQPRTNIGVQTVLIKSSTGGA